MSSGRLLDAVRLLAALVRHELAAQRRETMAGLVWLLVWPLIQAAAFLRAFDLARGTTSSPRVMAATYLGVLVWSTAASVLTANLAILRTNRDLITQIVFPFYMLSVVDVTVKYMFFLVQLALALAVWFAFEAPASPALTAVGVVAFSAGYYMFLVALAWGASLLGAVAPDLGFLFPPLLTLLLALSPIFQREGAATSSTLRAVNLANPIAHWVGLLQSTLATRTFVSLAAPAALVYGVVALLVARQLVRFAYGELAKLL